MSSWITYKHIDTEVLKVLKQAEALQKTSTQR
jgi:hypothetical protein